MVYLLKPDTTGLNEPTVLHEFLGELFSNHSGREILESLKEKYGILGEEKMEGELNVMCNLSEGIYERGYENGVVSGIERGIEKGRLAFAIDTYLDGLTTKEYIMGKFNLSADELEEAIKHIDN